MSDIRQAILEASVWIKEHPKQFWFMATGIPHPCESPGCALGWISYFAGFRDDNYVYVNFRAALPLMKVDSAGEFYSRMSKLVWRDWMVSPGACAKALRRYADKYHPAQKQEPVKVPDWNALAKPVVIERATA